MLKGDLSVAGLPAVLAQLADGSGTGCLHVKDPAGEEARVFFRSGKVYAVALPDARPQLGSRLVSSGALAPEALAEAQEAQRTELQGWRLGELLVHMGYVDQPIVEAVIAEQLRDAVTELLTWTKGTWRFRINERTREDVAPPNTVAQLLEEVSQRHASWLDVLTVIHDVESVPFLSSADNASDETAIDPDAWSLLCKVDGMRTVAELARDCGFTLYEGGHVICALARAGLLEIEDDADEPLAVEEIVEAEVAADPRSAAARMLQAFESPAEPEPWNEEDVEGSISRVSKALSAMLGPARSGEDAFTVHRKPPLVAPRASELTAEELQLLAKKAEREERDRRRRQREASEAAATQAELEQARRAAEAARPDAVIHDLEQRREGVRAASEQAALDQARDADLVREAEAEATRLAEEAEQARLAAGAAEAARLAEEAEAARLAAEAAEAARLAEEARQAAEAEAARLAEEAEAARRAAEAAEAARLAEEARQAAEAEAARLAEEAEAARLAEEAHAAEQARLAEQAEIARQAEEACRAEEAEEARRAEEAEEARRAEEGRLAAEAADAARRAEEAEIARQAEEARRAEEARLAAEAADAARRAEEAHAAEQARLAEEAEIARQAEEAAHYAEQNRLAEEAHAAEQAWLAAEAEAARVAAEAEAARQAEAFRQAEEARQAAHYAEQTRLAEEAQQAEQAWLTSQAEASRLVEEAADQAATTDDANPVDFESPDFGYQDPSDDLLAFARAELSATAHSAPSSIAVVEQPQEAVEPATEREPAWYERDTDTASLLRELSSLGLDDDEPAPAPRTPAPPPRQPAHAPSAKKRKGLFGR